MKKFRIESSQGILSFSEESFVFLFAIQKYKDQDIHNYNFAGYFVWVWNLVSNTEGRTQAEGVRE